MTIKSSFRGLLILPAVVLLAAGCAPKSPEEKVAQLRSFYTARPLGFLVDATPEEPMMDEAVEGEEPAEGEAMAEGEGMAEEMEEVAMEPVAVTQNVKLEILLQHDSPEKLPGITLDIYMVDTSETEVANWKLWVDTADLPKATGTQFIHLLENIDYQEGFAFSAEVRHPIPAEERGDYREFANAAN